MFETKEHLRITRVLPDEYTHAQEIIEIMRGNLAVLAALVMLKEGRLFSLHMMVDETEYYIDGDVLDHSFQDALNAMCDASNMDLTVEYEYNWRAGWQVYDSVGPHGLMSFLDDLSENDLCGIFYSAWSHADCSDGPGTLTAYGKEHGKIYHGEVEYVPAPEIPSGVWESSDTVIFLAPDGFQADDHPDVIPLCREMAAFSEDVDFQTDGGLDFCLNSVTLRDAEQGKRFLEIAWRLQNLMPTDFSMMANFFDRSGKDVRLMKIDDAAAGYLVTIAEI